MQRKALFAIVFSILSWHTAVAQQAGPLEPPDRSSPVATYESFMSQARDLEGMLAEYRQDKSAQQARQIRLAVGRISEMFDLSGVAPAARSEVGSASYGYLFDIILRLPKLGPDEVPPDGGGELEVWTYPEIEIVVVSEPVARGPSLHRPNDWEEFLHIQHDLLFDTMDVVAESQADFAFPSQTVYLRRDPTHGQVKG